MDACFVFLFVGTVIDKIQFENKNCALSYGGEKHKP